MCLCIDKSMEFYRCIYWETQLFTRLNDHCWMCFVATIKKKTQTNPFPWICESNFKYSPTGQNETSKCSLRGILEGSFQFMGIAGAAYSRDTIWGYLLLIIFGMGFKPHFSPWTDTPRGKLLLPGRLQCRSGSVWGVPWSLGQCGQWQERLDSQADVSSWVASTF